MQSAIFTGWVRHRRFLPVEHAFRYRIYMMFLNLDELPRLFGKSWLWSAKRPNLAWFKRDDYFGNPEQSLKTSIEELVLQKTGQLPAGPICLLTNMRYFGYCFNPVSFYYCFKTDGKTLQAIVADITNTPWKERHAYVLDCTKETSINKLQRFNFSKEFHVSPFMPMDIEYDWRFSTPTDQLNVHMRNLRGGSKMFDATMALERKPINSLNLAWVLLAYPFMTLKVIFAIHWQALWLWLKKVPFISHPQKISADHH
ncbi:DUF1365 domain-containing protein [Methyloradius palustris]|nr:DUF1365 domain-containing protein [Methyloradius palustris]